MSNPRIVAVKALVAVVTKEQTLAQCLPPLLAQADQRHHALIHELCYGCCRWYPRLKQVYLQLIDKPLKGKDADIEALVFLGLYQLAYLRIPAHAAINETVNCAKTLKKHWAVKFINGVLREFQRNQAELLNKADEHPQGRRAHPSWLIKAIDNHWPEYADNIFGANNSHPPFTLRVNRSQLTRDQYLKTLAEEGIEAAACTYSSDGVTLAEARPVNLLPGFEQGWVSVQDEAAQLAADLLASASGMRVLDACAAPGGKTCHLLEAEPQLAECDALDISQKRLLKVEQNLVRVIPDWQNKVRLVAADALNLDDWHTGRESYDRILLDAPCSATGVIRRHPDIKLLRLANQIDTLAKLQTELLTTLWQVLKPGGRLLYATCSIFPKENTQVIEAFLQKQVDAQLLPITARWGLEQPAGRQLLPQTTGHDGFFYALLHKVN